MTEHEGKWVYQDSYSGQDDTQYILCSCGWRTRSIWSRLEIIPCQEFFARHQRGEV